MQRLEDGQELNFQRMFQFWAFTTSHDQLLLRSTRSKGIPTRIDILFKQVGWVMLPSSMPTLRVRRTGAEVLRHMNVSLDSQLLGNRGIFVLEGGTRQGLVTARALDWHEDEGEYYDPTPLLDWFAVLGIPRTPAGMMPRLNSSGP